jgi:hypothetical protein
MDFFASASPASYLSASGINIQKVNEFQLGVELRPSSSVPEPAHAARWGFMVSAIQSMSTCTRRGRLWRWA